jgi:hypothetical protein
MTLSAAQIPAHLPLIREEFSIRYQNGVRAFSVTTRGLIVLAAKGWIQAHAYKGEVTHATLLVPDSVAQRVLSPLMARPGHGITRRKQGRGSKLWIERQDHAAGGHIGQTKRMIFGPTPRCNEHVSQVLPSKRGEKHVGFVRHYGDGVGIFTASVQ